MYTNLRGRVSAFCGMIKWQCHFGKPLSQRCTCDEIRTSINRIIFLFLVSIYHVTKFTFVRSRGFPIWALVDVAFRFQNAKIAGSMKIDMKLNDIMSPVDFEYCFIISQPTIRFHFSISNSTDVFISRALFNFAVHMRIGFQSHYREIAHYVR